MNNSVTSFSRGCVFFNFGTKCVTKLLVALYSLRKHYLGPITVFLDNSPYRPLLEKDLKLLDVCCVGFDLENNDFSTIKGKIFKRSPYDTTLMFDGDLLFLASPEPLFSIVERSENLVTRFYPDPHGLYRGSRKTGFSDRLSHFNSVAPFVTDADLSAAKDKLLIDRVDINIGVMGVSLPKSSKFIDEFCDLIEQAKGVGLADEVITNIIIHRYPHFLAGEEWNCPADSIFRQTSLHQAKIVHYFADGAKPLGKILGRNRESEAGKLWFKTFNEMLKKYPFHKWKRFDDLVKPLPCRAALRARYLVSRWLLRPLQHLMRSTE